MSSHFIKSKSFSREGLDDFMISFSFFTKTNDFFCYFGRLAFLHVFFHLFYDLAE